MAETNIVLTYSTAGGDLAISRSKLMQAESEQNKTQLELWAATNSAQINSIQKGAQFDEANLHDLAQQRREEAYGQLGGAIASGVLGGLLTLGAGKLTNDANNMDSKLPNNLGIHAEEDASAPKPGAKGLNAGPEELELKTFKSNVPPEEPKPADASSNGSDAQKKAIQAKRDLAQKMNTWNMFFPQLVNTFSQSIGTLRGADQGDKAAVDAGQKDIFQGVAGVLNSLLSVLQAAAQTATGGIDSMVQMYTGYYHAIASNYRAV